MYSPEFLFLFLFVPTVFLIRLEELEKQMGQTKKEKEIQVNTYGKL
jgi:hypothetical protein